MTPEELLDYCVKRGGRLWVDGKRLCYDFPKGVISERLLQALRENKEHLIPLLREEAAATERSANCKLKDAPVPILIAWEGEIPIYVFPGEKCIRCYQRPAVGTAKCPRWCLLCYERDQQMTSYRLGDTI